jgi:hypothetical protein
MNVVQFIKSPVVKFEPNADKLFMVVRAGHAANNEVSVFVLFAAVAVGRVTDCNDVHPLNILDETPVLIVVSVGKVIVLSDVQFWKIAVPIIPPLVAPNLPKNVTDCNDEHPENIEVQVTPAMFVVKSGSATDFNDEQFKKADANVVADEVTVGKTAVCKFVHPEKVLAKDVIEF